MSLLWSETQSDSSPLSQTYQPTTTIKEETMSSATHIALVLFCFFGFCAQAEAQHVEIQDLVVSASNVPGMPKGTGLPGCAIGENWLTNPIGGMEDAVYIPVIDQWLMNNRIVNDFTMAVDVDFFLRHVVIFWGPPGNPYILICTF